MPTHYKATCVMKADGVAPNAETATGETKRNARDNLMLIIQPQLDSGSHIREPIRIQEVDGPLPA